MLYYWVAAGGAHWRAPPTQGGTSHEADSVACDRSCPCRGPGSPSSLGGHSPFPGRFTAVFTHGRFRCHSSDRRRIYVYFRIPIVRLELRRWLHDNWQSRKPCLWRRRSLHRHAYGDLPGRDGDGITRRVLLLQFSGLHHSRGGLELILPDAKPFELRRGAGLRPFLPFYVFGCTLLSPPSSKTSYALAAQPTAGAAWTRREGVRGAEDHDPRGSEPSSNPGGRSDTA
jgi:hypothetical protein